MGRACHSWLSSEPHNALQHLASLSRSISQGRWTSSAGGNAHQEACLEEWRYLTFMRDEETQNSGCSALASLPSSGIYANAIQFSVSSRVKSSPQVSVFDAVVPVQSRQRHLEGTWSSVRQLPTQHLVKELLGLQRMFLLSVFTHQPGAEMVIGIGEKKPHNLTEVRWKFPGFKDCISISSLSWDCQISIWKASGGLLKMWEMCLSDGFGLFSKLCCSFSVLLEGSSCWPSSLQKAQHHQREKLINFCLYPN